MENLEGRMVGSFRIEHLLGKGGMGAVYRAFDTNLQRPVAIKVMLPGVLDKPELRQRFKQEGVAAARLGHPGIVKVYTAGNEGDLYYIVMEFIEGDNLQQMLDKQRKSGEWMSLADAVRVVSAVARALDHAHRQRILHRDIKPANIMMRLDAEGNGTYQPVVTDLGLAKLGRDGHETQTNFTMGTPDYMSPEQALGEATDARSDVYSLGVLLFELAVGRRPFAFKSITEATRHYVTVGSVMPSPRATRPDLPPAVETVIVRAMQRDPQRRFQSAAEMALALEGIPIASLPVSAPPSASRPAPGLYTQAQNSVLAQRGETSIWQRRPEPEAGTYDLIQVAHPDGGISETAIRGRRLLIGRDAQNEIQLDDAKVSRRHASVEFDGHSYMVTDLDSMNGTVLGQNVLTPNEPAEWLAGQTLRIGKHYLRLVRARAHTSGTGVYRPVTTRAGDSFPPDSGGYSRSPGADDSNQWRWKQVSHWAAAAVSALLVAFLALLLVGSGLFPGAAAWLPRPLRDLVPDMVAVFRPPPPPPTPSPTSPVAEPPAPAPAVVPETPAPTTTPSPSPTATPTATATDTVVPSPTAGSTPTLTATPTRPASSTPTLFSTSTPRPATPTPSPTSTSTPRPATPTPTPTPTSTPIPPPTSTPLPPPDIVPSNDGPPPAPPQPPPDSSGLRFRGQLAIACEGNRRVIVHGLVTVNGVPQNGIRVVFKSRLVPGNTPATPPDMTGSRPQYGCAAGCYEHTVDAPPEKAKHLEIYLIDANGQDISDRVPWNTDGPDGQCNTARVDFTAAQ